MSRQHLLVIGAGPYQLPAIRLAKARGFRVSATDMDPHAVGAHESDSFGTVSTRDVEATRDFALDLHRRHPVDGVMTMASESAVTVAAVAQALGLPGLDPGVALNATHKGRRQEVLHRSGVPSPRFSRATGVAEAEDRIRAIGLPVVVKPVDSAGSRAVRKITALDQLPDAIAEIRSVSAGEELVVEEFLTGSEHSIEGIVVADGVHWTGFSDRNYARKEAFAPYFLEDGDTLPTALSPAAEAEVHEVATAAVTALGITWGPVKGDILVDESGPRILEMAARLSGDYFCDETVPLHNGVELVPVVMDLSLGLPIAPDALVPRFSRAVALRGVWPPAERVTGIEGIDEAARLPGIHFVRLEPRWQDRQLPTTVSRRDRIAAVLASGPTRGEAVARAERAVGVVQVSSK